MRGKPWIDLGSHRDATLLFREYAKSTQLRIDSKTERLDIIIHANGRIEYMRTWPKINPQG